MKSRINGTLKSWNESKGFGFITPLNGGQDIFVHISDYPKQGGLPKVGEPISFEIVSDKDGKKKAVLVQRPSSKPAARKAGRQTQPDVRHKSSLLGTLTSLVLIVALGVGAYKFVAPKFNTSSLHQDSPTQQSTPTRKQLEAQRDNGVRSAENTPVSTLPAASSNNFKCDGRTHCSQMTSCAEATFFIRNCPDTKMDGNHDGIPCESQWCTGPFAK